MSDGAAPGAATASERAAGDDPAVRLERVGKSYGDTTALEGVSLSVETGEVMGLLGPNGAGKTTLVRAVTGTTDVDGTVRVFGRPPRDVDRARLGVLPQTYEPPGRLTARELLAYYGGLYERAQAPAAVLETVGVADAADTRYARLSGGQRRRVALAAALVNDPDLLVLDEPTAGIDPAGARAVRKRITALADGGTTVLVTGHDIDAIEALSDRVALLHEGDLVAVDTPTALVREYAGPARLLVETDAPPSALPDHDAVRTRRGLVVRGVERAGVGEVVDALAAAGVEYTSLRWARPSLEDAYLALTGRPDLVVDAGGDLNRAAAVARETTAGDAAAPANPDPASDGGDRP